MLEPVLGSKSYIGLQAIRDLIGPYRTSSLSVRNVLLACLYNYQASSNFE
jgi:hypothetical protein